MADKIYAVMRGDTVVEMITLDSAINISDVLAPDFLANVIEVTALDPQPGIGWTYTTDGWAPPLVVESTTASLIAYAATKRYVVENGGIELADGNVVRSDVAARTEIWTAYVDAQANPGTSSWSLKLLNGTWKVLDSTDALNYARQVIQFLVMSAAAEKACYDGITAVPATITNTFQIDTIFAQVHL